MSEPARSYADDIRARTDVELQGLVRIRPDLARPAPVDVSALAARAATRPSTQRALEQLDARLLRVLEAVLVAGRSGPEAAALLATEEPVLLPALQDLWHRGLLWLSPEGLRPARAIGEVLSHPAHLGPPAAELGVRPPADVAAAVGDLGEAAARVVDRLRWTAPRATFNGPALTAARDELIRAGLMVRVDDTDGLLPREVQLALRGGRLYEHGLEPPATAPPTRPQDEIDAAAGAEVLELLWRVEELARSWESAPPRVLRSGGLSVRDHRLATQTMETDAEQSAFLVEMAAASGLIAQDGALDPVWAPTSAYDDWSTRPPADRWALLAQTWWQTARAPSIVSTGSAGTSVNVLSDLVTWPLMRGRRHDVVRVLADLPEGSAPEIHDVDAHLRWRRPLRLPEGSPTRAEVVLREAAWLGVTGRGALSSAGRALVDGDDVAAAMAKHLPTPIDHVLLQADLTAIAPGPLEDDLDRFMRLAADVESRGGATVFRFTATSVRRALDAGLSAADVLARVRAASRTPVPQPLEYLIGDVARRHGQARVGSVGSYVRSDDETALSTMLADPRLAPLQLRRIAPTVLVSPVSAGTTLDLLRDHDHTPVAETSDGGLVLAPRDAHRSPSRRSGTPPVAVEQVDEAAASVLVTALRRREASEAERLLTQSGPRIPETDPGETVSVLQDAAAEQVAVWIGYVDETGATRRALFRPERVDGGRAVGTTDGSPARRTFAIHRITGVAPAR
ncbi:helicase-associated domain-containing protein [Luteipulveratus sp. YIM 133132]|uniref:helicase-associated domain-containing protein n=1 Tax=Luteipulveratus flavus TaxID=3031728 RepID=UPI0023AFA2AC|nr:helicase-associated domain-containing protein [Luteipulveratus sp. YIM 133132]MDE9365066.1 helicase-associated domain-containing protein [Luteipulveratus sp. YIM 133132]